MKRKSAGYIPLLILFWVSPNVNATLIDRGNGMIYDSDQDITWLQDANYAMTSGYDADGRMSWSMAMNWASNLSYGGYDDWRLPTVTDIDNDGCVSNLLIPSYNGGDCGYNVDTSGSELAYMWYENLGNKAPYSTSGFLQEGGLTSTSGDGVDILNLNSYYYWSGTEYINPNYAWVFDANSGRQTYAGSLFEYYAWAVRDGDVAAVPVPATALLMGVGLLGLVAHARRGFP